MSILVKIRGVRGWKENNSCISFSGGWGAITELPAKQQSRKTITEVPAKQQLRKIRAQVKIQGDKNSKTPFKVKI